MLNAARLEGSRGRARDRRERSVLTPHDAGAGFVNFTFLDHDGRFEQLIAEVHLARWLTQYFARCLVVRRPIASCHAFEGRLPAAGEAHVVAAGSRCDALELPLYETDVLDALTKPQKDEVGGRENIGVHRWRQVV